MSDRRKIIRSVKTNLAEILAGQVHKLRDISTARVLDKSECLLLKTCMELYDKKLDTDAAEDTILMNPIASEEEKRKLLELALKN